MKGLAHKTSIITQLLSYSTHQQNMEKVELQEMSEEELRVKHRSARGCNARCFWITIAVLGNNDSNTRHGVENRLG